MAALALYALLSPDGGGGAQRSAGATVDGIDNGRDTLRTERDGTGLRAPIEYRRTDGTRSEGSPVAGTEIGKGEPVRRKGR